MAARVIPAKRSASRNPGWIPAFAGMTRKRRQIARCSGPWKSPEGLPIVGETPTLTASGENLADDISVHVGQAVMAALKLEGKPGVVYSQAMQNSGMQVVDVDRVLDDVVTEVVRF